ncbi:MAG: chloride channel protein [Caulobacteraceae bacterium]
MKLAPAEQVLERLAETRAASRLRALRGVVRSSEIALTVTAGLVGAAAGLMVTGMSLTVQQLHVWLFGIGLNDRLGGAAAIPPAQALLWPVVGGVLIGATIWLAARFKRPPAVDPIEANALRGGRMSWVDSGAVVIQTLISAGFGASVGLEAGYTQAGSAAASAAGGWLNLRRSDMRVLVGAGAAGAIAAAFSAPITGAFYAFEVVIGAYAIANVAPVMAAAICGMLVSQSLGGALYHIETGAMGEVRNADYALYLLLGVVCAGLAIGLMRGVGLVERAFALARIPSLARPAIGGLAVGALALVTPQALSAGHGALEFNLSNLQPLSVIAMLVAVKMLASAASLGAGFRGGLFFASILLGALVGQGFAQGVAFTGVQVDFQAAAVVGMAAFAVAIVGGPLTMAFLVLETTGDYVLTGAVLATCVVVSLIMRETFGYSFSTFRMHLRGETIRSAHDVGWIRSLTVGRLMRKDAATAPANITVQEFRRRFPLGSRQRVVLLDEAERYAGMVSVPEAWRAERGSDAETSPVAALAVHRDAVLTPDMNVKDAMRAFDVTEAEALSVVDSLETMAVIGLLNEAHAVRRYAEELDKSRRDLIGEPG